MELPLDLPFPFFGEIFDMAVISNHGILSFGPGRTASCPGALISLKSSNTKNLELFTIFEKNICKQAHFFVMIYLKTRKLSSLF
jgi:hypothetical protein